ncbi:MAG: alkaline phosphatase family protein [Chitinophagaceae bacterium]|nr:alkaline phosphatase family protein [Chitinophagaceae bacterium]MCW5925457.1 alkaline phosphatase family protein [Chitinophagaceae bacterium]
MKSRAYYFVVLAFLALSCGEAADKTGAGDKKIENIIVITTDGLRWQELFGGMDSAIALKKAFVHGRSDSTHIFNTYWAADAGERRKKLLPFFWNTIVAEGQIYGNRTLGSKVDCANPYWFSYPGYHEILTGFPDTAVNSNEYPPNPHITVLEFINKQPGFEGRVAGFGAWGAFDRILNKERCGFPVASAFGTTGGDNPTEKEKLLNSMLMDSYKPFGMGECLDVFTHYMALEHLKEKQPRVLYIAYGETDEWAHHGQYKDYLDAARQWDKWVGDIWEYIQSTPQYKDKTALFITTDHGRGDIDKNKWTGHGSRSVEDSYEIWMAAMGPGITPKGEIKEDSQLYQKQAAQTIASLLGLTYTADHPIAEAVKAITEP